MTENKVEKTYAVVSVGRNRKLIESLRALNHKIIEIPASGFEKIWLGEEKIEVLKNIAQYDWLVFPDVFAAEFFLEILDENEYEMFELDHLRVCVFGEATADRLRYAQIHTDVIPPKNTKETIFAALTDYVAGESSLSDLKFLIVKKINENIELTDELDKLKIFYREVAIYRSKPATGEETAKLKALILGGAIDEFVFTSSEDWETLREIFSGANIKKLLGGTLISATDEATRQTLNENDIAARIFNFQNEKKKG